MATLGTLSTIEASTPIVAAAHQSNYNAIRDFLNSQVVHKDGSVAMSSASLLLGADATAALEAVTKQQMEAADSVVAATVTARLERASNLSDLVNVVTARSNLGLGSLATLSAVNNTNWSGSALSIANGGTGATSATAARTALGAQIAGSYAALEHQHTTGAHTHNYAASSHSHSYAATSHSHSYASTSHIHNGSTIMDNSISDSKVGAPATAFSGGVRYVRYGNLVCAMTSTSAGNATVPGGFRPSSEVRTVGIGASSPFNTTAIGINTNGAITVYSGGSARWTGCWHTS